MEKNWVKGGITAMVPTSIKVKSESRCSFKEGTFICPEGAATLSAAMKLAKEGWVRPGERVVLLNTGSGMKYPETVQVEAPVLNLGDVLPPI
jgi:threonine synthase